MKKIIAATNNKNKLRELRQILTPLGFEVLSQSEAGFEFEAEETGATFEDNAFLKARPLYEFALTDVEADFVLADDSGLEVDFLNGAPGVYSARYAPEGEHCKKLLAEMNGVPDGKRGARFVCAVCLIDQDGDVQFARGTVYGKIGHEEKGAGGFGYDPVFVYGGKTFAEMSEDEKNAVSHRADALKKIARIIGGCK